MGRQISGINFEIRPYGTFDTPADVKSEPHVHFEHRDFFDDGLLLFLLQYLTFAVEFGDDLQETYQCHV